ncbi:MAG: type IV pili methyl-accepting chemotaxis transducer N-terminal domain-containing protein [Mariprofundaceae bacterium]|nr:type IV pili methyl-accepting chemotaxis transducer N-terminal domain-containing protein [Mariprofundaceae bacterium]
MFYILLRPSWIIMLFFIANIVMFAPFERQNMAYADEAALKLSDSINVAGRQRMLTQRIVKFYYMIGLNVQKETSIKELQKTLDLFNRQLRQLEHIQGVDQALISKHLQSIQAAWQPVEKLARAIPTINSAPEIREKTDTLLALSNDFVLALEASKVSTETALVNTSGRQRMLSQRIASFYMERVWQVENKNLAQELAGAISDFNFALGTLLESEKNTPQITKLLGQVERQWHAFTAINKLRNLAYAQPAMVSDSAETILSLMNEITGLYAGL